MLSWITWKHSVFRNTAKHRPPQRPFLEGGTLWRAVFYRVFEGFVDLLFFVYEGLMYFLVRFWATEAKDAQVKMQSRQCRSTFIQLKHLKFCRRQQKTFFQLQVLWNCWLDALWISRSSEQTSTSRRLKTWMNVSVSTETEAPSVNSGFCVIIKARASKANGCEK